MAINTKSWITGEVPPGESLTQSLLLDAAISLFWIHKLEITPSASGGPSVYQIFYDNTFAGPLAFHARANSLSPFYDPVKRDVNGNMSNQGPGGLLLYQDEDSTGKLHVKITNQAAVGRTYEVKIWYQVTVDPDHNHDDRYYTETETDTLLAGKSDIDHLHDSRYYLQSEVDALLDGYVDKTLFDANSILVADSDDVPLPLPVAEQRIVGRKTGGNIAALTAADVKGILGYLTDTVDDLTPQAGGEFDFNGHSAGWASWNSYTGTSPSFDFRNGNLIQHISGAGNNTVTQAYAPTNPGSFMLRLIQDDIGGRSWTFPGSWNWLIDEPVWTDGAANQRIYIILIHDGTTVDVVGYTNWVS